LNRVRFPNIFLRVPRSCNDAIRWNIGRILNRSAGCAKSMASSTAALLVDVQVADGNGLGFPDFRDDFQSLLVCLEELHELIGHVHENCIVFLEYNIPLGDHDIHPNSLGDFRKLVLNPLDHVANRGVGTEVEPEREQAYAYASVDVTDARNNPRSALKC
jgi:hypothetical protein